MFLQGCVCESRCHLITDCFCRVFVCEIVWKLYAQAPLFCYFTTLPGETCDFFESLNGTEAKSCAHHRPDDTMRHRIGCFDHTRRALPWKRTLSPSGDVLLPDEANGESLNFAHRFSSSLPAEKSVQQKPWTGYWKKSHVVVRSSFIKLQICRWKTFKTTAKPQLSCMVGRGTMFVSWVWFVSHLSH